MSAMHDLAGAKKKTKKWVQGAIKHPGALKEAAKRNNRSTRQEAEVESHSSNPHIRARGALGLRFITGNI